MHPAIDAVIFDCDGTLVDSEHLQTAALAELMRAQGLPMSAQEAFRRFQGGRMADMVTQLERELGRGLPGDFEQQFRQRMAEVFREKLQVIEGARELVESLAVPACVASNGPRAKMELTLGITGLLPLFEGRLFSAYDVGSWKPEPGLFLHAAAALGVAPQRCVVIEDSLTGVRGALAAGMPVFAYQPGEVDPQLPAQVSVVRRLAELHARLPQRAAR
jgi:HAD superfamily hydrolase (TIGR01509 family)